MENLSFKEKTMNPEFFRKIYRKFHGSLDWFFRENLNRKPWFLPVNLGVPVPIFP
jgi:hypothetical protein